MGQYPLFFENCQVTEQQREYIAHSPPLDITCARHNHQLTHSIPKCATEAEQHVFLCLIPALFVYFIQVHPYL